MKHEFMMKRIGNLINDEYYDLPERYAPSLLDAGYINWVREIHGIGMGIATMSYYEASLEGRKAYQEWIGKQ